MQSSSSYDPRDTRVELWMLLIESEIIENNEIVEALADEYSMNPNTMLMIVEDVKKAIGRIMKLYTVESN